MYELNMRTEICSQILYLLQTLWFKAINFSFIHSFLHESLMDAYSREQDTFLLLLLSVYNKTTVKQA